MGGGREIATPSVPGAIKPGESFEVSSDGTLNLVGIPDTLFTPVKEEMKTEINKAVSESGHLKREVVDNLPLSGIDNVIYMKSKSGEEDNIYDEYMWINQKWERIGSSEVDLSNYPTKQALEESMTRTLTEAKQYTDQEKSKYVPLAGNVSISNQIAMNAEPASAKHIATKQYVDNINVSMIEAENRRETAEGKREASEVKRATAESQRALAETERVSSENARRAAETARVAAENARKVAENSRSQTFSNNLISWEEQVSAETTKANQASEEARRAAETANTAIEEINETLDRLPIYAENILTGTATGVIAHADDVYTSKALGFNIYGKSSQYTTTGANKFNPAGIQNGSSNGITWTKNENGSITISGTSTALVNINLVANPSEFILSTGKWTGSVKGANKAKLIVQTLDGTQICNTNTSATRENKTEQGLKYFLLQVQAQTTLDETIYVYLEKSDKALYEEYTDGKPSPSPKYPREITNIKSADLSVAGRNLLNIAGATRSGWNILLPNAKLQRGAMYTYKAPKIPTNALAGLYAKTSNTKIGEFIKSNQTATFTVLDEHDFSEGMFIAGGSATALENMEEVLNTVMVEAGSTATTYEPYQEPITSPINLQGNELCSLPNGVRDEVRIDKDGNISLIKKVVKIDVEKLAAINAQRQPNGKWLTYIKVPEAYGRGNVLDACCNRFTNTNTVNSGAIYGNFIITSTNLLCIGIPENLYPQTEDTYSEATPEIKAWFDEMKIGTYVYAMAVNPQTIPLGKIDMPTLPAPVCNAWANDENPTDVKFSYIRDVNIAYEKLASALASAMNIPTTIPELEL